MHPLPGMSRATRTPNDGSYNGEYDWTSTRSSTALPIGIISQYEEFEISC